MTRRSYLLSSQRIDLLQRRRARTSTLYSEQPVPLDIRRLPGTGEGSGEPATVIDMSWLSPDLSWTDDRWSWLT